SVRVAASARAGPAGSAAAVPGAGPRSGLPQQGVQEPNGARLAEGLVTVAALGGLDAGGAPGSALAGGHGVAGRAQPGPRGGVAAFGEPRASLVSVVDEDGEQS